MLTGNEEIRDADQVPNELERKLAELAALSPLEYDQQREDVAKELKVRVGTLDKEVAQVRGDIADDQADEVVEEITPWSDPVNGDELLTELIEITNRHVILPAGADVAVVLWSVGTYCMDAWRVWPKLLITSPEKRCGKSTLLEAVEGLVYRALITSNITPSAIFRCVEEWVPSLLIDEADTFAKDNDELNGVINAGHTRRTAAVIRTEKEGDGFKPKKFSVWCPQVIAGIGEQRGTLHDRSIHIEMRRKTSGESVSRIPAHYYENNRELRRRCLRWAEDNVGKLKAVSPGVPSCGNDRAEDNWSPLFAIAHLAGGDWLDRVVSSYHLINSEAEDDSDIGTMLLSDIQQVFDDKGYEKIFSKDLVEALADMEDRPWCEWRRGNPITQNSLSKLLKPYKIRPTTIRFVGDVAKGYWRYNFKDAFDRYLNPSIPPIQSVTPLHPCNDAGSEPIPNRYTNENVTDEKRSKPSNGAGCNGVTVQNGGNGEMGGIYHGYTLADLEAAASPDEWADVKDDPQALEAFAKALMESRQDY